jgi:hypothetical protein
MTVKYVRIWNITYDCVDLYFASLFNKAEVATIALYKITEILEVETLL